MRSQITLVLVIKRWVVLTDHVHRQVKINDYLYLHQNDSKEDCFVVLHPMMDRTDSIGSMNVFSN